MEKQAKRRANISTDIKIHLVDIKKCGGVNIIDDTVRGAEEIEVIENLENRTGFKRKMKTEPRYGVCKVKKSHDSSSSHAMELKGKGNQSQKIYSKVSSQNTPVKTENKTHHPLMKQRQLINKTQALHAMVDDAEGTVSTTEVVLSESEHKKQRQQKRNQCQANEKEVDPLDDEDETGELYSIGVERRLEEDIQKHKKQRGHTPKHSSFYNPGKELYVLDTHDKYNEVPVMCYLQLSTVCVMRFLNTFHLAQLTQH